MKKIIDDLIFRTLEENEINEILELEKSQSVHILSKNIISQELKNSLNSKYFVATYESEIIAYISISVVLDICDISSIVVKKEYEKNGVGSYLLTKVFEKCKSMEVKKILLEVRKSNEKAIKLYTKNNFTKIAERKNYYTSPKEDAYIFEYML